MLDSNKFYIRIVCNIYKEKLEKYKFYIGFGGTDNASALIFEPFHSGSWSHIYNKNGFQWSES